MFSLNRAQLIGNCTKDPEVRQTTSGQQVASFSVATNRAWTDKSGAKQEMAEYHNVVAWGKLAEICGSYVKKGTKVYVEGRLQTRDWEGQDGLKRFRTEIVCDNIIMLSPKTNGPRPAEAAQEIAAPPMDEEIPLSDIPF